MEHSGWLLLSNEGLAGLAASETLLQLTCDSIAIRDSKSEKCLEHLILSCRNKA